MVQRAFFAFLLVLAAASPALAERRVALVMAADEYETIRPLENAVNDAEAIEATLEGLGFEVFLETDRDLRRMRRALDDFREDAAGADVALVFFAGHGIEIAGENRLLPVDADASSLDALKASTLPLEEVRETVASIAKIGLIMLDACRNDPLTNADGSGRGVVALAGVKEIKPGFGRMGRAENILFAFSAAPGQTASDGADGHSPFATALGKYIGTDGLEIRSVLTLVQQEVYDKSLGKQLPYVESGLPSLFFAATTTGELPERERLLLAMADVTPELRAEVEQIATDANMPLAPLYGALISSDGASLDAGERSAKLHEAADAFVKVRTEMRALASDDPEVTKLRQQAEEQLALGAFETARVKLAEAAGIDGTSRRTLKENFVKRTLSEAATHYMTAGAAHAQLDYGAAITAYETTLAVYGDLKADDFEPDDLDRHVATLKELGDVRLAVGNLAAARQAYQARLQLIEAQLAKLEAAQPDPLDTVYLAWQSQLSVSRASLGDVLSMGGDHAAARAAFEQALTISIDLAIKVPAYLEFQAAVAANQERLGKTLLAMGDAPAALAALENSLSFRKELAKQAPDNRDWQRNIAVAHNGIGDVRYAMKDLSGALADYQAARAVTQRLADAEPQNPERLRDLMIGRTLTGDARLALGDQPGALTDYVAALEGAKSIVAASPGNAGYRRDLSVSHTKVGDIRFAMGDSAAAAESFVAGLEIAETLAAGDPDNAIWQRDLIIGHYSLAQAGESPREHLEKALAIADALKAGGRLAPADDYIPGALRDELAALEVKNP